MVYAVSSDAIRLKDIVHAIEEIEGFTSRADFSDRMLLMAVAYEIAIIGESAGKLSKAVTQAHPHIPWGDIIGMRHRIVHDYGNISAERIKAVVNNHLPQLKQDIAAVLASLSE
jgi:uncharacterized protein with HEPN domain